tara:strand:+ start:1839 stop:4988 length:3150 start_codon:yes stop_codon:yes gene_type:complete
MKKFKVFKSSAGSGKTFTLVKEFLKICLRTKNPFAFTTILAITFTNKATFEMKGRVVAALETLSGEEANTVLADILSVELELSHSEIAARSKVLLAHILHNYADLNISTIDKFSHKILRTFAKDLGLSINFQVEIKEEQLLLDVIREMMDQVGRDELVSDLLLRYVDFRMQEEKSWKLENELHKFSRSLIGEQSTEYLKSLRNKSVKDFQTFQAEYKKNNQIFENQLIAISKKAMDLIDKAGVDNASFAGTAKISIYFRRHLNLEFFPTSTQLTTNVEKNNWYSGKCTSAQKGAIDSISNELTKLFYETEKLLEEEQADYLARRELLKQSHNLALINQIEKRFATLKASENLLNISDFNRLIAGVVLNEPIPFIYERLGEKYKHLMIDEFQDTSVLQFLNLLPLLEESLAKGHENLIVGDAKQAIYRFRGGEVDQFAQMPFYKENELMKNDLVQFRMQSLQANYSEEQLDQNFRSSPNIVQFNNQFFDFVKQGISNPRLKAIFEGHEQTPVKKNPEGYVEISFLEGKSEELDLEYADLSYQKILQALEDGYSLKDIAVLCRKKADGVKIADYLKQNGISIISSEALLIAKYPKVEFLVNLLKWMFLPEDDFVKKEICLFLYENGFVKDQSLNAFYNSVFKNGKTINQLFQELGIEFSRLNQLGVFETVEALIRHFGMNMEYDLYLQFLLDNVFDFTNKHGSDVNAFLLWWEDNKQSLSLDIPDDLDAVSIMTIHKSKGLEFPIVIYPFANEAVEFSSLYKQNLLWVKTAIPPEIPIPFALSEFNSNLEKSSLKQYFDEELIKKEIDLINQTYVAFTRASNRLYILSNKPEKAPKDLLNLYKLLMDFTSQGFFIETSSNSFAFGDLQKGDAESNKTIQVENDINLKFISESWETKLKVSKEGVFENMFNQESKDYGIQIHMIMSKLNAAESLKQVLTTFELSGQISSLEKQDLQLKLENLLQDSKVRRYFEKSSYSKREVALTDGKGGIFIPDRVVYFKDEVAVLDFKTGDALPSHSNQVEIYKNLLQQTTNIKVKGYLLYTEKVDLIEV